MNRNELVKAALEAGITKANTMKSVVLEEMLAGTQIKETKRLGRPVNMNSERQKRLSELELKRANGELRRGRPVNENSERQVRLLELETKRLNGELKRGRPVNQNSDRQIRLAELEAKRANGELRRGRPKMIKVEE
jgi:hypothetical protein